MLLDILLCKAACPATHTRTYPASLTLPLRKTCWTLADSVCAASSACHFLCLLLLPSLTLLLYTPQFIVVRLCSLPLCVSCVWFLPLSWLPGLVWAACLPSSVL